MNFFDTMFLNPDIYEIQHILEDARKYGLELEVQEYAQKLKSETPDKKLVEAYRLAYQEWVK